MVAGLDEQRPQRMENDMTLYLTGDMAYAAANQKGAKTIVFIMYFQQPYAGIFDSFS